MKDQLQLKWYHFLLSWLFCLLTGLILGVIFDTFFGVGDLSVAVASSLAVTVVATILSSPFIILFCLVVHFAILKKTRPPKQIHALVFALHIIGSILVLVALVMLVPDFRNGLELSTGRFEFSLLPIMGGYFVIDSFYFHLYINKKAVKEHYENTPDSEILDSNLI